jgi:CpcD/allophycocyanin linker domain
MIGQATQNTAGAANGRIFVYEVTGLRQNDRTENSSHFVRKSGSTLIQVPYSRMNSEMRRIGQLGGQIVNIYPLTAQSEA